MTHAPLSPSASLPIFVLPDYLTLCEQVAARIAALVQRKPEAVLGLATGASAVGIYAALVRRHRQEKLDFSRVTCFNLDEYYPMPASSQHSYHAFMRTHLFDHINCRRWSVPDGQARSVADIQTDCALYEKRIEEAGGIDVQLLGIGRSGHLGFNEPGSSPASRTRLVTLHPWTREDAAPAFGGLEAVPTQAISMGLATIFSARRLLFMASGPGKAAIVHAALTGAITPEIPASLVRRHPDAQVFLTADAMLAQPIPTTDPTPTKKETQP